jgi:6-phosphogluconolactonase
LRYPLVPDTARLFVGTYTNARSEGIYCCRFDAGSGRLEVESVVKGVTNPSYLAIDRSRGRLFCVNETAEFEGMAGGSASAFALNVETGEVRSLNRGSTHGADPCYLTIDPDGRFVLVANYTGGSLAVLPVQNDGSLGEATDIIQHQGSSVKPRQQAPHAHSVVLDSSGRFAYAADLGLDKVMIYRFDGREGKLLPSTPGWAGLNPGAGPRHLAFSPDGSRLYVANELDSTMTVFSVEVSTGGLEHRQTVSTLPTDFTGENFPADIHVAQSGRFVYCSNRGHDSIAVFAVETKTGEVSPVQHESTCGKWPRNFTIDPTGQYMLVANQRSDTITVFAIDPESGTLTPNDGAAEVPSPVCLKFL